MNWQSSTTILMQDWEDETTLHIVREEVREQESSTRYVAVPAKAIELLKQIPRQSEYIFTRDSLTNEMHAHFVPTSAKYSD